MAAVMASGEEQGRHGAARRQLGIPLAYLPHDERPKRGAKSIPKLANDI